MNTQIENEKSHLKIWKYYSKSKWYKCTAKIMIRLGTVLKSLWVASHSKWNVSTTGIKKTILRRWLHFRARQRPVCCPRGRSGERLRPRPCSGTRLASTAQNPAEATHEQIWKLKVFLSFKNKVFHYKWIFLEWICDKSRPSRNLCYGFLYEDKMK